MRPLLRKLVPVFWLVATATAGNAATLQVTPVSLDVRAPQAAETIRLRNLGSNPVMAQIRVFRWFQSNGKDRLVETRDVVASPPFARIAPNGDYLLRIIRVTRRPVSGEENYRLLVDQLPDRSNDNGKAVKFVLRQSIPVFFRNRQIKTAAIHWSVVKRGGRLHVTATNTGSRHIRVSSLRLAIGKGRYVSFGEGLNGYVLGHSTARWTTRGVVRNIRRGSRIQITARGDNGPIKGTATLRTAK